MSEPKPFQLATIDAAMKAFDGRRTIRRFLVADEVGLGKTVVAREIIKRMMAKKVKNGGGPFRVFYVCSSLAIASQNRANLLKVLPVNERHNAEIKVDRLTLAPIHALSATSSLHLYTLTPDTSIPDRKGKQRSGAAMERALLHNLLSLRYPDSVKHPQHGEWLQCQATSHWHSYKGHRNAKPTEELASRFFHRLRSELGLDVRQQLPAAIRRSLDDNHMETLKTLRVALARCGLELLNPDLVIFDEFQKFTDVLVGEDGGSEIARQMTAGRAVLLLSATPYHLYGGDFEHGFGEATHHEQFHSLIEWLLGGNALAKAQRGELEAAFQRYADALRSADLGGEELLQAKQAIEGRLRGVMARTERFGHTVGQEAVDLVEQNAPLIPEDIQAFRHLAECLEGASDAGPGRALSTAVPYWSSIPLPMQMMGKHYKAWDEANRSVHPMAHLRLTANERDRFVGPQNWPHPRLRALGESFPPSRLSVPWIAPSLPWWELSEQWLQHPPDKVLLFSRFVAVPRAVASLLSFDLERFLLAKRDLGYGDVTTRTVLGPSRENLVFFHPSWALAAVFDPWTARNAQRADLDRLSEQAMTAWLASHGVTVAGASLRRRELPELVVGIERKLGIWNKSVTAWRTLAGELARTDEAGDKSLRKLIDAWDQACPDPIDSVSSSEVTTLARMVLSNPGVVLARAFRRAGLVADNSANTLAVLRASWEGLRSYLNNPWMESALGRGLGARNIRERIGKAVLDGNLESVLDEHLWVMKSLRSLEPEELPKSLADSLALRTSDVTLHAFGQSSFSLRAHAALAFSDKVKSHRPDRDLTESSSVRTDELRQAFNSPFWPYVLASTSVGQEGLDFHTWCSTVAHWDIPSDPVDLEQREGRVDRYGGIATRRAIARELGSTLPATAAFDSPWNALAAYAERTRATDPSGLTPWWLYPGAKVRRLVFDVPLSEAKARFHQLREQRLLYRLALGQPDQEDLVNALRGKLSAEHVRSASINLSPWSSK